MITKTAIMWAGAIFKTAGALYKIEGAHTLTAGWTRLPVNSGLM